MIDTSSQIGSAGKEDGALREGTKDPAPAKQTRAGALSEGGGDEASHGAEQAEQGRERGQGDPDGEPQRMGPWPPNALMAALGLDVEGEGGDNGPEGSAVTAANRGAEGSGAVPMTAPATPDDALVQRKANGQAGGTSGTSGVGGASGAAPVGAGEPLAPSVRGVMEQSFGADLSAVRVHQGDHVTAMGAQAYAQGTDLHFAPGQYNPQSQAGRELIGHEVAHVVQQAEGRATAPTQGKGGVLQDDPALERQADEQGARAARGEPVREGSGKLEVQAAAPAIQRRVQPEDVAIELVGREFTLSAADGGLLQGTIVRPTAWVNASRTVPVTGPAGRAATVQKSRLRPRNAVTPGMHQYRAGINQQATSAEAGDQAVAEWRALEASYRSNRDMWTRELARREQIAATRNQLLNRRLIQETQLNRFDAIIQTEVNNANAAAGLSGAAALDPNLVKSMIFQETQMGTAGEHLGDPSSPVKTRFNLGQTIDSSGSQLLMLMEREHTTLITRYHLGTMRADLEAAMRRKAALEAMRTRTPAQEAELRTLATQAQQNWEYFIWGYKAPGQAAGFGAAVLELFRSPGGGRPPRNEDYQFWIHLMVMWLFEKKRNVRTWAEAIRAYNGSGTRANHYRDAVVGRRDDAAAASTAGTSYVPDGI